VDVTGFDELNTVTQELSGPDREVLSELLVNNAKRFQTLAPAVSDWYERAADVIRALQNDLAADHADLAYALACDSAGPPIRLRGFDAS
jgi:hypothetical protein